MATTKSEVGLLNNHKTNELVSVFTVRDLFYHNFNYFYKTQII